MVKTIVKKSKHIPILVVLSLVFLSLLGVSTAQIGVDYNYSFEDEIIAKTGQTQIGELSISNDGFLPARINLKKLYGCILNEDGHELYITYTNALSKYNYYRNGLDIKSKSSSKYQINIEYFPILDKSVAREVSIAQEAIIEEDFQIAIFESDDQYSFGYCSNNDLDEAIKVINVKIENE